MKATFERLPVQLIHSPVSSVFYGVVYSVYLARCNCKNMSMPFDTFILTSEESEHNRTISELI